MRWGGALAHGSLSSLSLTRARRRFLFVARVAVSHESGAALAAYCWVEGGCGKGYFRSQADVRYLPEVARVHHALAQGRKLDHDVSRCQNCRRGFSRFRWWCWWWCWLVLAVVGIVAMNSDGGGGGGVDSVGSQWWWWCWCWLCWLVVLVLVLVVTAVIW